MTSYCWPTTIGLHCLNDQTTARIKMHFTTTVSLLRPTSIVRRSGRRKTWVVCRSASPFSLRTSPAEFFDNHRPDLVAPPEGKHGAADTMSGTDQRAGLPNLGGCFNMDMGQDQIGSQPLVTSESRRLPATPGCGPAATGDSAACWPVRTWVGDSAAELGVTDTSSVC
jgi:hypothetical protein